jgi:hypothetical protein
MWDLPGVGKTTLAQLAYNDDSTIMKWFDFTAWWLYFSEEFDVSKVTRHSQKGHSLLKIVLDIYNDCGSTLHGAAGEIEREEGHEHVASVR